MGIQRWWGVFDKGKIWKYSLSLAVLPRYRLDMATFPLFARPSKSTLDVIFVEEDYFSCEYFWKSITKEVLKSPCTFIDAKLFFSQPKPLVCKCL